jgi:hypothetical protein
VSVDVTLIKNLLNNPKIDRSLPKMWGIMKVGK